MRNPGVWRRGIAKLYLRGSICVALFAWLFENRIRHSPASPAVIAERHPRIDQYDVSLDIAVRAPSI